MEANKMAAAPPKPGPAKPKVVIEAYSFRKHGWPSLRKAAITFGIALLVSGALVTAGRLVLAKVGPDTAAAQARQISARDRLAQGQMERIDIRDFQPRFEQLKARGFVGVENRLAMVEAIQAIQKKHRMMPITFSLLPQKLVVLEPTHLEAPLELHASGMQLRLDLVHEMDLLTFFSELKARGFFTVKECSIASLGRQPAEHTGPRLTAECSLFWLSVGEPAPPEPPPVEG